MKCSNCGNEFSGDTPFCPFCGAKVDESVQIDYETQNDDQQQAFDGQQQGFAGQQPNYGGPYQGQQPNYGGPYQGQQPNYGGPYQGQPYGYQPAYKPGQKDKLTAGLLAIFLGGLGIHKFYMGWSQEGVIMLLCSIFGAFLLFIGPIVIGIIALIEGITYLSKSDIEFYEIYEVGHKTWF